MRERPQGYLEASELPDGVKLLPPPPAQGSAAQALDDELNRRVLKLRDTPRWALARQDAIPHPGLAFSCVLDVPLTETEAPTLFNLLIRAGIDAGAAVMPPKKHYQRKRPFLINEQPICTDGDRGATARNGAYPSGHTAAGWIWALILTELEPERADEILARGHAYGQSREICNVHWHSDVVQGRVMASALYARLQANESFRDDMRKAAGELAALRQRSDGPGRKCDAERQVLSDTDLAAL